MLPISQHAPQLFQHMENLVTRKDSIKKACSSLFRQKGYAGTSMQDIANVLGIKAASLYNHINSKQEILQEMLSEGAELFVSGMNEIATSSLSPIEKLERIIVQHIRLAIDHTDLMALMTVEWRHLEEPARERFAQSRNAYEEDLKGILRDAQNHGQISQVDVEIITFSILTTLQRFYSWYDRHSDYNAIDLEKFMIQCLLGGIRNS